MNLQTSLIIVKKKEKGKKKEGVRENGEKLLSKFESDANRI